MCNIINFFYFIFLPVIRNPPKVYAESSLILVEMENSIKNILI